MPGDAGHAVFLRSVFARVDPFEEVEEDGGVDLRDYEDEFGV